MEFWRPLAAGTDVAAPLGDNLDMERSAAAWTSFPRSATTVDKQAALVLTGVAVGVPVAREGGAAVLNAKPE